MEYLEIISLILAIPVLIYVSFTDIRERRIPNRVMFPALAVAFTVAMIRPERGSLLLGGLIMCGIMLIPSLVLGKRTIGGGDVKLAFFLGLILGMPTAFWAILVTYLIALVYASIGLILGRLKIRSKVAFAPFLALGSVIMGTLTILWQYGV
ncbi:MAG: leader peptidase (prepilin peptidase) / N-methyltransferase [Chloroflexi bacterium AL-W]|nr:leader peptidase (prepilin peptidase) / N-methyltransferase [Chloroflexi bacterium AL-N1]NOK67769.1 leader peptidase (prepilin peptidase) / N-methyltransferase [Chloroflexi bacterium AL-N10]NOK75461.1 leader peptidase (prepilin peptidase) / N-methyltransferase [Chloroflexi bacterium AL-N5]NOK82249.1 leader peptidase (prepilin peptidase) / N-methyltransferase [Chloroflexi bacterium AL-W]NOK90094.1 leader peptidase (prepilin peptidase) / N-methyltransferase [Chloroflexi bacterium AL-N15]